MNAATPYRLATFPASAVGPWWQRIAVVLRLVAPERFHWHRQRVGGRWAPVPRGLASYRWTHVEHCPATWPEESSPAGRWTWHIDEPVIHRALRTQCLSRCVCEVYS